MSADSIGAALARRTRAQQGLPEHVEDPVALAQVAGIMRSADAR